MLGNLFNQFWDCLTGDLSEANQKHALGLIGSYINTSGPETLDRGIELDLRYDTSPFIYPDGTSPDPWKVKSYTLSTRPGCRAPHAFLKDGSTSMYDLLGVEWTLSHFVEENEDDSTALFTGRTKELPVEIRCAQRRESRSKIWERDIVLVRPDTHVAWRANKGPSTTEEAESLQVVSGYWPYQGYSKSEILAQAEDEFLRAAETFTCNSESDRPAIAGEAAAPYLDYNICRNSYWCHFLLAMFKILGSSENLSSLSACSTMSG
jgi:FAD-dependent monooxygenase